MDERRLGRYLKVPEKVSDFLIALKKQVASSSQALLPDNRIALAAQVHQVRVGIVQREHDPVRGVQLDHHDGLAERVGRPQTVLPLGHLGEAGREHQSVSQEDGARRLRPLVADRLGLDLPRPRVDQADLLVLARRQQLGPVPIEAGAVDDVRMAVDVNQRLTSACNRFKQSRICNNNNNKNDQANKV